MKSLSKFKWIFKIYVCYYIIIIIIIIITRTNILLKVCML